MVLVVVDAVERDALCAELHHRPRLFGVPNNGCRRAISGDGFADDDGLGGLGYVLAGGAAVWVLVEHKQWGVYIGQQFDGELWCAVDTKPQPCRCDMAP